MRAYKSRIHSYKINMHNGISFRIYRLTIQKMLNTAVLLFWSLTLVSYLENDETVVEVGVEVVDPGFHAQAVHPVPVHLERTISQD